VRFAVTLWLLTRVAIFATVAASVYLWPAVYLPSGCHPYPPLSFVDGLCQWDCQLYADIAATGYSRPVLANFWPLFPLLARPLVWLHIPPKVAVIVIANLAALGAFIAVYRVFQIIEGELVARWGLGLLAAYPFSFFFGVGYSESVMVLCSAGGLWLALRGRILWAAVLVGAGMLSRMHGILTVLAFALILWRDHRDRKALLALALTALVAASWPLYLWLAHHDPLYMVKMRRGWGWHAYLDVFHGIRRASEARILVIQPIVSLIPGIGAFALLARRRWWPLALIAVPFMLINWSVGAYALGRYSAACWPAFLPLAMWLLRRPTLQLPIVIALAVGQGFLLQLFAHAYELQ
jgi:hypothetical protein